MEHPFPRHAQIASAFVASAFCTCFCVRLPAQMPVAHTENHARLETKSAEGRASRAYELAQQKGPLVLHSFLNAFPKGADLHVHLSGAIYAETFIRDAAEDGLCVDPAVLKFAKATCEGALVPAARLSGALKPADQDLYDRLVDSFSMRSFIPTPGFSGHDQFFSTFGRFSGIDKRHTGEWVDEVAGRAAAQNQQ